MPECHLLICLSLIQHDICDININTNKKQESPQLGTKSFLYHMLYDWLESDASPGVGVGSLPVFPVSSPSVSPKDPLVLSRGACGSPPPETCLGTVQSAAER